MRARWLYVSTAGALLAAGLALGIVVGAFGGSGSPAAAGDPGGTSEGIEVHGHWTIEVRNPDGSLVERREFDNALIGGGARQLKAFLSRQWVLGSWFLFLGNNSQSDSPCLLADGTTPGACRLREPALSVAWVDPGTGSGGPLELSGAVAAQRDGSVAFVTTFNERCTSGSVSPATCAATERTGFGFSSTALSPAVPVQEGQLIQVTVEIDFS